ncbi:MAG TPA: sigma-70 family RNA polymerase sigma factor [Polyangiaceae bacterium]|nr:sigma-70 family RNA polymerase sigma factor [Polyangiaceae bacterium]
MASHFTAWVSNLAKVHTRALAAVAVREGLSRVDAVDAVQEAFSTLLSLPQARELSLDDEGAERLMSVIVRNAARNMRRRHHRRRAHESLEEDDLATDLPDVDTLIAAAEQHVALLGCVGQLGRIQRHVVRLRLLEELTPEDTARELGLTSGNVAVLLHRAKKALHDCIELGSVDD